MSRFRFTPAAALVFLALAAPAQAAPPAHDNFASAALLSGSEGTYKNTNREATKETGEPNHAGGTGGASVWHRWVAPRNGRLFVTTKGSGVDTLLAVYTGESIDALTEVASNDDAPNTTRKTSDLSFAATKDTTYHIAVDGFTGRGGTVVLAWVQGPENDDFAHAQELTGASGQVPGTTKAASAEPNERGPAEHSIWYRWVAPASMSVLIDTRGSRTAHGQLDTYVAVYRGDALATLKLLAAADDLEDGERYDVGAVASFKAVRDTTYYIAVRSWEDGATVLRWGEGSVLRGTAKANRLTGTAGKDIIISGGGADVIRALGGNDEIVADGGDDRIFGGSGDDVVFAGGGSDVVRGEAGRDRLYARDGTRGNDTVVGGPGVDTCRADKGDRTATCA